MSHGSQQLLDRVDARDRVIGSVQRQHVFREGSNFRVAHLFLYNVHSELLLQRLAPGRKRHPGRWGSSVAAYVSAGEDYEGAIRRRALQELGVRLDTVKHVGTSRMEEEGGCIKFIGVFAAQWNSKIRIDRSHVSEARFTAVEQILQDREAEPNRFTPTFLHLADRYLAGSG